MPLVPLLRLIAGQWRGRTLRTPPGLATRPTSERLRQALFDMLAHAPWSPGLPGQAVLDAFAGTGALGLEALSRGAASATFMEHNRAALDALRANAAPCQGVTILAANVLHPPPGTPCTLVFLDPPYGENLLPRAIAALAAAGWIAPGALLAAEAGRGEPLGLGEPLATRTHGAGQVTIWRHLPSPPGGGRSG